MRNYTIQETFTLPSKGKVYDVPVDAQVTLRSMTLLEELKKTSPSQYQYKSVCDAIEDCMVTKPNIHVYDMCIGDYQFLVHKLRAITFGTEYKLGVKCSVCGNVEVHTMDLDELEVLEYDSEFDTLKTITLPQCEAVIELQLQTPRILDTIEKIRNERLAKDPEQIDPRLELVLMYNIAKVDGKVLAKPALENFVHNLSMKDVNYILKSSDKLNGKIGIDTTIGCSCSKCKANYLSTFRITPEFYYPSID